MQLINEEESVRDFFIQNLLENPDETVTKFSNRDLATLNKIRITENSKIYVAEMMWIRIDVLTKLKFAGLYNKWLNNPVIFPRKDFSKNRKTSNKYFPATLKDTDVNYFKEKYEKCRKTVFVTIKNLNEFRIFDKPLFNETILTVNNILIHSGVYSQYPTFKHHKLLSIIIVLCGKDFCGTVVDDPELVHTFINYINFTNTLKLSLMY